MNPDPIGLQPVGKAVLEDDFPYYPGQLVRAGSSSVFKYSRWLAGSWKANLLEGIVTKVTVGPVLVKWSTSVAKSAPTPNVVQEPQDLKLLSCFAHTNWQFCDLCVLPRSEELSSITLNNGSRKNERVSKEVENFERTALIINIKSKVNVAWQDGTMKRGMVSTSLIPIDDPEEREVFAEQYVVEKAANNDDVVETKRVGIVKGVNAKDQIACVRWLKAEDHKEFDKEEVVSVYELEKHPSYDYWYGDTVVRSSLNLENIDGISGFGIITGLKDGDIEVTWADGITSTVGPQSIHVLDLDDESDIGDDESSVVETGSDTGNDQSTIAASDADDSESPLAETGSYVGHDFGASNDDLPVNVSTFKVFDIIKDPLDHHFFDAQRQNFAAKKWLKKVQQDWHILQNDLPEGIYVRVYEDRMDLLRAVIVGAPGTPYQDGLFFFDFYLPPEYPDVPPSAYYHSGGWRINPNLYEEGKVCLSLLNTWTGRGNEVWNPSGSSILQVLVSLQGLVLNSKPYFNEAGYDKQVGTAMGEKSSLAYNESTFLLNCKSMIYLMRKPPKDFEALVFEHFRERGHYILEACDAYKQGNLIGSLAKDGSSRESDTATNSAGFKMALAKIAQLLFCALNEVRADCKEFMHLSLT